MKMKDQMMALGNLISGVSLPTSIHIPSFYLEMKKSLRFPRLATNINGETCIMYIDRISLHRQKGGKIFP